MKLEKTICALLICGYMSLVSASTIRIALTLVDSLTGEPLANHPYTAQFATDSYNPIFSPVGTEYLGHTNRFQTGDDGKDTIVIDGPSNEFMLLLNDGPSGKPIGEMYDNYFTTFLYFIALPDDAPTFYRTIRGLTHHDETAVIPLKTPIDLQEFSPDRVVEYSLDGRTLFDGTPLQYTTRVLDRSYGRMIRITVWMKSGYVIKVQKNLKR